MLTTYTFTILIYSLPKKEKYLHWNKWLFKLKLLAPEQAEMLRGWEVEGMRVVDFSPQATVMATVYSDTPEADPLVVRWRPERQHNVVNDMIKVLCSGLCWGHRERSIYSQGKRNFHLWIWMGCPLQPFMFPLMIMQQHSLCLERALKCLIKRTGRIVLGFWLWQKLKQLQPTLVALSQRRCCAPRHFASVGAKSLQSC